MSGTTVQPTPPTNTAASTFAAKNEAINVYGRVAVSLFVLFMTAAAILLNFIKLGSIDAGLVDLLKTLSTIVVAYWVGSSASSTTKQGQLATQTAQLAASTPPPIAGPTTLGSSAGASTPGAGGTTGAPT